MKGKVVRLEEYGAFRRGRHRGRPRDGPRARLRGRRRLRREHLRVPRRGRRGRRPGPRHQGTTARWTCPSSAPTPSGSTKRPRTSGRSWIRTSTSVLRRFMHKSQMIQGEARRQKRGRVGHVIDAVQRDPSAGYGPAFDAPPADDATIAVITEQLGRPARGRPAVMHRCGHGLPTVVRVDPRLEDGTPFPTTFWLACPLLRSAVGRMEADHEMVRLNERLAEDASFQADYTLTAAAVRRVPRPAGRTGRTARGAARPPAGCHGASSASMCTSRIIWRRATNPVGAYVADTLLPMACPAHRASTSRPMAIGRERRCCRRRVELGATPRARRRRHPRAAAHHHHPARAGRGPDRTARRRGDRAPPVDAIAAFRGRVGAARPVATDTQHVRIAATSAVRDASDPRPLPRRRRRPCRSARRRDQRHRGGCARLRRCDPARSPHWTRAWSSTSVAVRPRLVVGRGGEGARERVHPARLRAPHRARPPPRSGQSGRAGRRRRAPRTRCSPRASRCSRTASTRTA